MEPADHPPAASPGPVDHPISKASPVVPDHDLIRCVGVGSYGEVWLAKTLLGTYRAIKVIARARFQNERPYEREFAGIRRFEPLSRTHPGFVSILHVGRSRDESYFYYVMELADDLSGTQPFASERYAPKTLAALLTQRRMGLVECLRTSLTLASALAYLHDHQLVHRDLKPSNIIFVHSAAKLADIGLVTAAGQTSTFVGTPGFIPPEGPGSPRADLFALGKVIYAMATGKEVDQFPELPTDLGASPDARGFMQLNDIVLRACLPEVRQRIQSVHELHQLLLDLFQTFEATAPTSPTALMPARSSEQKIILCTGDDSDSDFAQQLAIQLRGIGFQVSAENSARVDLEWARAMERRFETASCIILLISTQALKAHGTAYLTEIANQAARRGANSLRFLAVLFQLTKPLPRFYRLALEPATQIAWTASLDAKEIAAHIAKEIE